MGGGSPLILRKIPQWGIIHSDEVFSKLVGAKEVMRKGWDV